MHKRLNLKIFNKLLNLKKLLDKLSQHLEPNQTSWIFHPIQVLIKQQLFQVLLTKSRQAMILNKPCSVDLVRQLVQIKEYLVRVHNKTKCNLWEVIQMANLLKKLSLYLELLLEFKVLSEPQVLELPLEIKISSVKLHLGALQVLLELLAFKLPQALVSLAKLNLESLVALVFKEV